MNNAKLRYEDYKKLSEMQYLQPKSGRSRGLPDFN